MPADRIRETRSRGAVFKAVLRNDSFVPAEFADCEQDGQLNDMLYFIFFSLKSKSTIGEPCRETDGNRLPARKSPVGKDVKKTAGKEIGRDASGEVRGVNYWCNAWWSSPVLGDQQKKSIWGPHVLAGTAVPGKGVNPGKLPAVTARKKTRHPHGCRVLIMGCPRGPGMAINTYRNRHHVHRRHPSASPPPGRRW